MQKNTVKEMLKAGKTVYGTSLEDCLGSEMPVILAKAGLDFFFVDTEHSPASYSEFQALVRTSHYAGIVPLLRVTQNRPELISRALDNGAMGVIVPRVKSLEDAREALDIMKFPPEGHRGFGLRTINTDVMQGPAAEEIAACNRETLAVLMVETTTALEQVEEIAKLPGLDVLFIGPYDLSLALGIIEQFDNPIFLNAVDRVVSACKVAGIATGLQTGSMPLLREARRRGVRFLMYNSDVGILLSGYRQAMSEAKAP
jgi:2-keto-3-deoxy-L-rhamnonate aldolase RhmA